MEDCRYCGKALVVAQQETEGGELVGVGSSAADGVFRARDAGADLRAAIGRALLLLACVVASLVAVKQCPSSETPASPDADVVRDPGADAGSAMVWPQDPDAWADRWITEHAQSFRACAARAKPRRLPSAPVRYELRMLFDQRGLVQETSVSPPNGKASITACMVQIARMMGQPPVLPSIPKEGFTKVVVFSY